MEVSLSQRKVAEMEDDSTACHLFEEEIGLQSWLTTQRLAHPLLDNLVERTRCSSPKSAPTPPALPSCAADAKARVASLEDAQAPVVSTSVTPKGSSEQPAVWPGDEGVLKTTRERFLTPRAGTVVRARPAPMQEMVVPAQRQGLQWHLVLQWWLLFAVCVAGGFVVGHYGFH